MSAAPPRTREAPTAKRSGRVPLVLGAAASLVPVGLILAWPQYAAMTAGLVLLAIGFVVMAPCSVQMALTMTRIVDRAEHRGGVAATASSFALGYLAFYLPFALLLGLIAYLLGEAAWIAVALGAAVALVLGLATLRVVNLGALSRCRGPLWLLRSGRASFQRPTRAGFAFGQYCATCCGPYVLAIAVLAGGSRSFWIGAGLVFGYALLMVLPFLAPAVVAPQTYARLGQRSAQLLPRVEKATGLMLLALFVALVPATVATAVL